LNGKVLFFKRAGHALSLLNIWFMDDVEVEHWIAAHGTSHNFVHSIMTTKLSSV
jgi:hypothetical protein